MTTPKQHPIREEASALGDRATGAMKDFAGEVLNDPALEQKGEEQNASGRARQGANEAPSETPSTQHYVASFSMIRSRLIAPTSVCVRATMPPRISTW